MLYFLKNSRGISLIETIAALLITTVILFSFYGFFISSKKTNVQSSSISDATYHAQMEMENMYTLATGGTSDLQNLSSNFLSNYSFIQSSQQACSTDSLSIDQYKTKYEFIKVDARYTYRTNVYHLCNFENSGRIEIEVSEMKNGNEVVKAVVEGVYIWK